MVKLFKQAKNWICMHIPQQSSLLLGGMIMATLNYYIHILGRFAMIEVVNNVFLLIFLILITKRNMQYQIFGDKVTYSAMGAGVIFNILGAMTQSGYALFPILGAIGLSLLGIIIGGGSIYLCNFLLVPSSRKKGPDGEDIKLTGAIGAFVGPYVIVYCPLWLAFGFIYCVIVVLRGNLREKHREEGRSIPPIPSIPVHFVAIVMLLSIQRECVDFVGIMINLVILFLGSSALFEVIDESRRDPFKLIGFGMRLEEEYYGNRLRN